MLSSRMKTAGAAWLLLAACATAQPARAQTTLRYQFKEGDKIPYLMEQKMKMTMEVMGQTVEMAINQAVDMTWNIQSVDKEGKAKLTQRFDRIRFTMEGPMGTVEYDSKDGKEPADQIGKLVAPVFKAMVGSEIGLTMDSRGRTTDVKVPEKLTNAIKEIPGVATLGEMFSEEGLKRMVDQGTMVLPEGAAEKGKSWDQKNEMKMPFGKMKADITYTYEGPTTQGDRKLEQVAIKPKVAIEPDPAAAITIKLKDQNAKGTARFDNAAGKLVETSVTQNMEMEITANGMNIAQKIEQVVTLKLQDKAK